MEMKKLRETLIADLRDIVKESVDEAFEKERKNKKRVIRDKYQKKKIL